jgi:hypothetical protein
VALLGLPLEPSPSASSSARAVISLDANAISLLLPDGLTRRHQLDGCAVVTVDATCNRRFVKMLILERVAADVSSFAADERLTLITPPDRGAIAPWVARVSAAPRDAIVIETEEWEALTRWLLGGGRLAACSVVELARLASIASPQFAVVIGEVAAELAVEGQWDTLGPLRGRSGLTESLRPLYDRARRSPRAADALGAALARAAVLPRARRGTG